MVSKEYQAPLVLQEPKETQGVMAHKVRKVIKEIWAHLGMKVHLEMMEDLDPWGLRAMMEQP